MYEFRKARFAFSAAAALALLLTLAGPADAGTLTVEGGSKYAGSYGLKVTPDATPAYVQSSHPSAEKTYRVRFYLNLTRINLASGSSFDVFAAYNGADPLPSAAATGNAVLRAAVRQAGSSKVLDVFTRTDSGEVPLSSSPNVSSGWHAVELEWSAATAAGANNGSVRFWMDGVAQTTGLPGLDSDTQVVNYSRWGSVTGATTGTPPPAAGGTNTFRLDDFSSQRSGYIGPAFPFADNPTSSPFFPFIQGIYAAEVIPECAVGSFCPDGNITRKEMAKFLLVARYGANFVPPACTSPMFSDVPCSHPYAIWINEMARQGITGGCAAGVFCPEGTVTRSQMAVFLMVASGVSPAACPPSSFLDVPSSSPFCPWVNEIAQRGITAGCGGGNFCPASLVSRGQMAVFLTTTFGLPTHVVGP